MDSRIVLQQHKKYYSIGEVSKLCELEPHVLRYWEVQFVDLSPEKRRGNRRYYQQKDIELIKRIKSLLFDQNHTVAGVKVLLENPNTTNTKDTLDRSTQIDQIVERLQKVTANLASTF